MKKNINIYWVAAALFVVLVAVWFLTKPGSTGNDDMGNKAETVKQTEQAVDASTDSAPNADSYQSEAAESNVASTEQSTASTEQAADSTKQSYPVELDGGKLLLNSIFQFDGINPDCNNEECSEVASIQLLNQSGEYLKEATINITLTDGTSLKFQVYDVPANMEIYAFDVNNTSVGTDSAITSSDVKASYQENAGLLDNGITAEASDQGIKVTNNSDQDYTGLTMTYHDSMDGILFGGIAYQKSIDSLKKGQNTNVSAEEIIFGEAFCTKVE